MITVYKASAGKLQQLVNAGRHSITSDVSLELGGDDAGFDPHDLLDASLGACTAITVTMVAQRKKIPLTDVRVKITHEEDDTTYRLQREIELVGELTAEQRSYLLGIANKCPVHRSLGKKIVIETRLEG
jgi:putative redox protein